MKKLFLLISLFFGSFTIHSAGLFAQSTVATIAAPEASSAPLDAKTQKKVDKARVDLAKSKQKLTKDTESNVKTAAKFEKNKSKGKLSPIKIEKEESKLKKQSNDLEKLKDKIAKLEKYLSGYK